MPADNNCLQHNVLPTAAVLSASCQVDRIRETLLNAYDEMVRMGSQCTFMPVHAFDVTS